MKKKRRKKMGPQGAANYSALLPVLCAALMAIAGFSYTLVFIEESMPTVMTELRASRTYAIACAFACNLCPFEGSSHAA